VVLTGANGAGKTNLLEAVSFLSPGRGLRRVALAEVGRREPNDLTGRPWAVAATVETEGGVVEIGTGLALEDGDAAPRRVVRIDGKPARGQGALAELLGALWITPEMDKLFAEGAGARRRFLDRLVFGLDAAHATRLAAYERALRDRARLLRGERIAAPTGNSAWMSALERTMAEEGVAVVAARQALAARLNAACQASAGPFPAAHLRLEGEVESWLATMPALDAEDRFREALARARARDAETGGAALGPHRSDVIAIHVEKGEPAARCSTGEQKALLVAIVVADARLRALDRGTAPLLLLDEIAAHLDAARRAALFGEITSLGAQAWMSGTDEQAFTPILGRAQHFRVERGQLVAA
jgi:DNA replication and repair protein RecF